MTDSPLFSQEDVDLVRRYADEQDERDSRGTASCTPGAPLLFSLADRIQQWLDQQGTPLQLGQMSVTWLDGHGSIVAGPQIVKVIDETDLTEG